MCREREKFPFETSRKEEKLLRRGAFEEIEVSRSNQIMQIWFSKWAIRNIIAVDKSSILSDL